MLSTSNSLRDTQIDRHAVPDKNGRFGPYGGSYVPETLFYPLKELGDAYEEAKNDPSFREELEELLKEFAGRPTEIYYAKRLSEKIGGAKIFSKEGRSFAYRCS